MDQVNNGIDGETNQRAFSVMDRFKGSLKSFASSTKQVCDRKNTPRWFHDFSKILDTFFKDIYISIFVASENSLGMIESELTIQKAVTDGLENARLRLEQLLRENKALIYELEGDLEDLRQYSRCTNLLIHGLEEEAQENTDHKVLEVLQDKLQLPLAINDIGRTHRLGQKREGKKRPIIARFISYRKRKIVFDVKKNPKGSRIVITENLTRDRYSL